MPPADLRAVLDDGLATGAYGWAVALVCSAEQTLAEFAVGEAQHEPERRPLAADTLFDLASLTKVVAGVSAALILLDRGLWSLDDPAARLIPGFAIHGKGSITIRQLLTHSSGLPPWAPLYLRARSRDEALPVLCDLQLEASPGSRIAYSDLGFVLLAYLVEATVGEGFAAFVERELFVPLGMRDTCYLPDPALRARCAATACGNAHEVAMLAADGLRWDGWREGVLMGEVHDGNAHYALGGVSAHAGLFSTAANLSRLCRLYLAEGDWEGRQLIGAASIAAAITEQAADGGQRYGLGWRLAAPFMDLRASDRAFGHTGFTGTSMVIDPTCGLASVLLTNAVHTDPDREGIARVRPRFHDAAHPRFGGAGPGRVPDGTLVPGRRTTAS